MVESVAIVGLLCNWHGEEAGIPGSAKLTIASTIPSGLSAFKEHLS